MQNRSLHKIPSISRRFVAFIHTLEMCNLYFDNCTCRFPLFFHNEDQKSARTYISSSRRDEGVFAEVGNFAL